MLIDSHCHLDFYTEEEREEIIKNATSNEVKLMQTINTRISKIEEIIKIANSRDFIYASVGTHPENAHDDFATEEEIIELCKKHKKIIGIGETGLDYYHSTQHKEAQKKCFWEHIKASIKTQKPLIVHTRNADEDTLEMLSEGKKIGDLKILMHCFTGGENFAKELLKLGAFISFSGIVTFKNANEVLKSFHATPLDKLLIETDAPFLAPVPMRGKRNEPAFLKHTAMFMAAQKNLSLEEFGRITSQNFTTLFNILPA